MPHLGVCAETFLDIEAFLQPPDLDFQRCNLHFQGCNPGLWCFSLLLLFCSMGSLPAGVITILTLVRALPLCLDKRLATCLTGCFLSNNINHLFPACFHRDNYL